MMAPKLKMVNMHNLFDIMIFTDPKSKKEYQPAPSMKMLLLKWYIAILQECHPHRLLSS